MNTSSCKGIWTDSSVVQGQEILQKWHIHEQVCLPRAGHKAGHQAGQLRDPLCPTPLDSTPGGNDGPNFALLVTGYLHFSQWSKLPAFSQWGGNDTSRVIGITC